MPPKKGKLGSTWVCGDVTHSVGRGEMRSEILTDGPFPQPPRQLPAAKICKHALSCEGRPFASHGFICPVPIAVVLVGVMNFRWLRQIRLGRPFSRRLIGYEIAALVRLERNSYGKAGGVLGESCTLLGDVAVIIVGVHPRNVTWEGSVIQNRFRDPAL